MKIQGYDKTMIPGYIRRLDTAGGFTAPGFVPSLAAGGNSTLPLSYSYTDGESADRAVNGESADRAVKCSSQAVFGNIGLF
jgi:hypothetical protein